MFQSAFTGRVIGASGDARKRQNEIYNQLLGNKSKQARSKPKKK